MMIVIAKYIALLTGVRINIRSDSSASVNALKQHINSTACSAGAYGCQLNALLDPYATIPTTWIPSHPELRHNTIAEWSHHDIGNHLADRIAGGYDPLDTLLPLYPLIISTESISFSSIVDILSRKLPFFVADSNNDPIFLSIKDIVGKETLKRYLIAREAQTNRDQQWDTTSTILAAKTNKINSSSMSISKRARRVSQIFGCGFWGHKVVRLSITSKTKFLPNHCLLCGCYAEHQYHAALQCLHPSQSLLRAKTFILIENIRREVEVDEYNRNLEPFMTYLYEKLLVDPEWSVWQGLWNSRLINELSSSAAFTCLAAGNAKHARVLVTRITTIAAKLIMDTATVRASHASQYRVDRRAVTAHTDDSLAPSSGFQSQSSAFSSPLQQPSTPSLSQITSPHIRLFLLQMDAASVYQSQGLSIPQRLEKSLEYHPIYYSKPNNQNQNRVPSPSPPTPPAIRITVASKFTATLQKPPRLTANQLKITSRKPDAPAPSKLLNAYFTTTASSSSSPPSTSGRHHLQAINPLATTPSNQRPLRQALLSFPIAPAKPASCSEKITSQNLSSTIPCTPTTNKSFQTHTSTITCNHFIPVKPSVPSNPPKKKGPAQKPQALIKNPRSYPTQLLSETKPSRSLSFSSSHSDTSIAFLNNSTIPLKRTPTANTKSSPQIPSPSPTQPPKILQPSPNHAVTTRLKPHSRSSIKNTFRKYRKKHLLHQLPISSLPSSPSTSMIQPHQLHPTASNPANQYLTTKPSIRHLRRPKSKFSLSTPENIKSRNHSPSPHTKNDSNLYKVLMSHSRDLRHKDKDR